MVATLDNVTFTGNRAAWGGAIHADDHDLTLNGCTLQSNTASLDGGGIFHVGAGANLVATNTSFTTNEATQAGGALHLDDLTTTTLVTSPFDGNTATEGGAIHAIGALGTTECDFTGNMATIGRGGAIWVDQSGLPEFTDITGGDMVSNTAESGGGAMWIAGASGQADVTDVHFDLNESTGDGGAALINGAVIFDDCVFTGNGSQAAGGAVGISGATAVMRADFTDWALPGPGPGANTPDDINCLAGPTYNYNFLPQLCCTESGCVTLCP